MKLLNSIKKAWNNFLMKLAKENERNFGSQKMDCCDLNQKGNQR